jgi:hypothetical protein
MKTKTILIFILILIVSSSLVSAFSKTLIIPQTKKYYEINNVSNLTNYFVPYTGATSNLNLGTYDLTALNINANNGLAVTRAGIPQIYFRNSAGGDGTGISLIGQVNRADSIEVYYPSGKIDMNRKGTWSGADTRNYNSYMTFSTLNDGNLYENMRIDGKGNIGIGTDDPQWKLDVKGQAFSTIGFKTNGWVESSNEDYTSNGWIGFGYDPTTLDTATYFGMQQYGGGDNIFNLYGFDNESNSFEYSLGTDGDDNGKFKIGVGYALDGAFDRNDFVMDGNGNIYMNNNLEVNGVLNATKIKGTIITGTSATAIATAEKEVTIPDYTLEAGDILAITLTNGNSASAMKLNINSGGAIDIYLGATALTTTTGTISAGGVIQVYYDGTYFRTFGSYRTTDSDTTYMLRIYSSLIAGEEITRYKTVMEGANGRFYPLTIGDVTTGSKTINQQPFKLNGIIATIVKSTTTSSGSAIGTALAYTDYALSTTYVGYSFNGINHLTAYVPAYLVGTINTDGLFVLDNSTDDSYITTTIPTTEDGKVYLFIGFRYGTETFDLRSNHQAYEYKNGAFREYIPVSNYFAEGYYYNSTGGGTPYTITVSATNTSYNLTNWTAGEYQGFTFTENGITSNHSGIYQLSGSITFTGGNDEYSFTMAKNGESIGKCGMGLSASSSSRNNVGLTCLVELNAGDHLNLYIMDKNSPPTDVDIYKVNLNIVKVSD